LLDGSGRALALEMLMGTERLLAIPDDSNAPAFDEADIAGLSGGTGGTEGALLISIKGRIYDVREGARFYGPGKSYHAFSGRDASALLCTGCVTSPCLLGSVRRAAAALARGGTRAYSAARTCAREADRWLEFFEMHDKYPFVGVVPTHRALAAALAAGRSGDAEAEEDAVGGAPEAFLRLSLHALLGPRVPSTSRALLVDAVLKRGRGVDDAEAMAEARADLDDSLRAARAVGDDTEGLRAIQHMFDARTLERGGGGGVRAESGDDSATWAASLAAIVSAGADEAISSAREPETDRTRRRHENAFFRPR
jgi:hypothetical protein